MSIRALFVSSIASLVLILPASAQSDGPPPALVQVDAVKEETLDRKRNVTGELRAAKRSNVASKGSGLVVEMEIEVGDHIVAGSIVAKLDDTLARIEVTRREAEVRAADALIRERQTHIVQTTRDMNRLLDLRKRNGASQNELDDAKTDVEAAQAQLAQANAELATRTAELEFAKQELRDMIVRAPFTGTVVRRDAELGQWIDEGETAVELVQLDMVDVYLDIPEAYIDIIASMNRPITMTFANARLTRESMITDRKSVV